MLNECPLGIFDSGVGGLTILRKVIDELPQENIVYLADTARIPYGDKSPQCIIRYSLENAAFLVSHSVKMLIVACHTSSAYSVSHLKEQHSISVIDVIDPAVDMAIQTTRNRKIAVLGTRATINSGIYRGKIIQKLPDAEVFSVACPLFVPLVEEDFLCHPATELIVREYMKVLTANHVDTVILGCTHYPLLLPLIQKELGKDVQVIDSALVCAKRVAQELDKQKITRSLLQKGKRKYYASDDTEKFRRLGESFLGIPIETVGSYLIDKGA